MRAFYLVLALALCLTGCGDPADAADAGGGVDGSAPDSALPGEDASVGDAGPGDDAGGGVDAGAADAGGGEDVGAEDAGPVSMVVSGFPERIADGLPLLFDVDFDAAPLGALEESVAEEMLYDYRFGIERASMVESPHGHALRTEFIAGECCFYQGFRALRTLDRVARQSYVHYFRMRFAPGFERSRGGKMGPSSNFDTDGNGISQPRHGGYVTYMWRRPGLRRPYHCGPRDSLPSSYEEDGLSPENELELHAYINHRNMIGDFSDECFFSDDAGNARRIYEVNTWISVVTRITPNTPGEQNGRVEIWTHVEGESEYTLVLDESTFEWVTEEYPDNGIEKFSHNPFYGGNNFDWAPGRDSAIEIADSTSWGL